MNKDPLEVRKRLLEMASTHLQKQAGYIPDSLLPMVYTGFPTYWDFLEYKAEQDCALIPGVINDIIQAAVIFGWDIFELLKFIRPADGPDQTFADIVALFRQCAPGASLDCSNMNFNNFEFPEFPLRGVNFSHASFEGADFTNVCHSIWKCNFMNANLLDAVGFNLGLTENTLPDGNKSGLHLRHLKDDDNVRISVEDFYRAYTLEEQDRVKYHGTNGMYIKRARNKQRFYERSSLNWRTEG